MQDTRSEHNAERIALALAALGAALATLVIAGPRLFGGPLLEDWIGASRFDAGLRWTSAGIGVGAGLLASIAASLSKPVRDRGQSLGICCGGILATAAHAMLVAHAPHLFESILSGLLVIPLGVAAAALLRDHGLRSLALAGLVVGAPIAFGRAAAIGDRHAATMVQSVREAMLQLGVERAFGAFDASFDRRQRRALQASLLPPHLEHSVAVHAVEPQSENERLLHQAGMAGVRCVGGTVARVEPEPANPAALRALAVHAEMQSDGTPVVRIDNPSGKFTLRVVTPLGAHRQSERDPTAGLMLLDDVLKSYLSEIAGLPAATQVLVRAEDDGGAASPWIPLAMPSR